MPTENVDNVYAKNIEGYTIHVSSADSGRKGYYCLGCNNEMQAVKHKISNRIDYFRHDPKNVKSERKCTYSDETYRHKLAKEILQRIKRIKVPALYKYPPRNEDGLANLLEESRFIEAYSVGVEKTFYEDENGEIHYGSNKEVEDRFLVIRPDVTFFNSQKEPILFIEIIVTHGIDTDKLAKLKRLGINTVQIRIPIDSPESIEKSFSKTDRIKWIYNYVEERTEYLPISKSDSEGIPPTDEEQKKLLQVQESIACRTAEIGNLIRSIKRCLESKLYRDTTGELTNEISRTSRNTETNQSKLERLRDKSRRRVEERLREQIERVDRNLEGEKQKSEDLERRYYSKRESIKRRREEIEDEDRKLEQRIEREIEDSTGSRRSFRERKEQISRDREEIIERFRNREFDIKEEQDQIIRNIEDKEHGIAENIEFRETISSKYRQLEDRTRREFEQYQEREREEIERTEQSKSDEPRNLVQASNELRGRFEKLRDDSVKTIKARDGHRDNELSRGIHKLLQTKEQLDDVEKHINDYKRYRKAWESFNNGSYKDWND